MLKMSKYVYHLISTTWRKKTSVLFIAVTMVLIVIGIQYNRKDGIKQIVEEIPAALMKEAIITDGVNFVEVKKLANISKSNLRHNQQYAIEPTQSKHVFDLDHTENRQLMETNQQLGIPIVLSNSNTKMPYIPQKRLVHLDLKGAPPLISFYRRFFPFIRNLGATGLLIEYEDMFPYSGILKNITANNAYSKTQVIEILRLAQKFQLEVIPLIQTFGHLEFALKVEEFSRLREVPRNPQAICPNRNGTLKFIEEMVNQVMALHPDIKYLHIGSDEVFQIGECELCRLELHETLFLRHVSNVSTMILKKYPYLRLIIWDDMLRHIPQQIMLDMNLGTLVEPMVWVYAEDIYRFVQPLIWTKYSGVFPRIWAASAFKGAFGETLYVPDAKRHLENNLQWLSLMSDQTEDFKEGFTGLALTGWQRYDHFSVLCEVLPAGTPSLALSLTAITHGYFNATLKSIFLSGLSCPKDSSEPNSPFVALDYDPFLWDKLGRCLFPGSQVFRLVYRFHSVEQETKEFLKQIKEQRGWLTDYQSRRNFSSPTRVEELVSDLPRLYQNMVSLVRTTYEAMEGIFDNYTISEWVEQRLYSYIVQLEELEKESSAMKSVNVWPVRPLPVLPDLARIIDEIYKL